MRIDVAFLAATLALGACQPKVIYADNGYVRLPTVKGNPGVAYLTVHGGAADTTLLSIGTEVAIRTEMHESMTTNGMSTMKPIDHIPLPADGKIVFAPGAKHVMLFDINPIAKPGNTMALILTFANGERIQYDAKIVAAGAPPPT